MTKKNCSEYCKNSAACCKEKVDYFTWNVPMTECPEYKPISKTSTYLDLDKTALVFARTLHGQNWANLSKRAQQTSIKAFKNILLNNCKADD